jgi:hypothetical protein
MLKKTAFAFAAAITISSFAVSSAQALSLGSLSRRNPVVQSTDVAALAFPAVCQDRSCGVKGKVASDYSPVMHIVFSAIGGFVRDHMHYAVLTGEKAGFRFIALASAE